MAFPDHNLSYSFKRKGEGEAGGRSCNSVAASCSWFQLFFSCYQIFISFTDYFIGTLLDQAIKPLDSPFKQWWMFLVFHMFCDIWESQVLHLISAICFSGSHRHTISKSKSNKTTSSQILLNVILHHTCQHKFSVSDSLVFLPNPHTYHFKIFILFMEHRELCSEL